MNKKERIKSVRRIINVFNLTLAETKSRYTIKNKNKAIIHKNLSLSEIELLLEKGILLS